MKQLLKKVVIGLLITALAGALAACSTQPQMGGSPDNPAGPAEAVKQKEDIKITAIMPSSDSEVTTGQVNAMQAYAEAQGVQFTSAYYNLNVATQAGMIENAVTSGTDVIIMFSNSEHDCINEITMATEAGVTVILYMEDVPKSKYTYLFTEDGYSIGFQMGTMAANWANENLVANGDPVNAVVGNASVSVIGRQRNQGIIDALKEICPQVNVQAVYDMAYKSEGLETGEAILSAYPDTNLVVGVNDQSANGVYDTFVSAGKQDSNIGIFGIDGTDEALYNISNNGIYKGVINIDSNKTGERMVQAGIDTVMNSTDAPKDKINYFEASEISYDNIEDYKDKWSHVGN